jgi:hypothetical protein
MNPNDPAFPIPDGHELRKGEDTQTGRKYEYSRKVSTRGLTKLEEFAKAAMQGLCANPHYAAYPPDVIAKNAVEVARQTIAELNKEPNADNP